MRVWRFGIRSADEGAVRSVIVDTLTLRERELMATNSELSNAFDISLIPLRLGSEVAGRHPVRLRKSPAPGIEFGDRLLSKGLKYRDVTAIHVADSVAAGAGVAVGGYSMGNGPRFEGFTHIVAIKTERVRGHGMNLRYERAVHVGAAVMARDAIESGGASGFVPKAHKSAGSTERAGTSVGDGTLRPFTPRSGAGSPGSDAWNQHVRPLRTLCAMTSISS
jgi:hypothetical protein